MQKTAQQPRIALFVLFLVVAWTTTAIAGRLLYPQREALRRAEWSISDVEKKLAAGGIDAVHAGYLLKTVESVEQRLAGQHLPQDNQRVQKLQDRIAALKTKLKAMASAQPAAAPAQTQASPARSSGGNKVLSYRSRSSSASSRAAAAQAMANYPHFNDDLEKMRVLIGDYKRAAFSFMDTRPEMVKKVIELNDNLGPLAAYLNKRLKEYQPLFQVNPKARNDYMRNQKWLDRAVGRFIKKRNQFLAQGPNIVANDIARSKKGIQFAFKNRQPLAFRNVKNQLKQAEAHFTLYKGLKGEEDPTVQKLGKMLAQAQLDAKKAEEALEQEIIATNKPPADQYRGGDRKAIIAKVKAAWQKNNPGDEILEIRVPYKEWRREVGYKWNGAASQWEKYDRQYIQLAVVVKSNDKVATIYPAFINRDNLSGRERIVASHKSTYEIRKVLLKNL